MADSSPQQIAHLVDDLKQTLSQSISQIGELNDRTHVLAINARIEAARAGIAGRGFRVVADAFGKLNVEIQDVSQKLTEASLQRLEALLAISDDLASNVEGARLMQMADSVMDVVDRNLYERSCDVRWWATDPLVIHALEFPAAAAESGARLGVILNAYTVYYDIVVVDTDGRVVVNGRPDLYALQGVDVGSQPWFSAVRLRSGDEFAFQSAHQGPLAGGAPVLVYSCPIRSQQQTIGVLGVVFRWEGLGRVTLDKIGASLDAGTELLIVDADGRILASRGGHALGAAVTWKGARELLASPGSGFRIVVDGGVEYLVVRGASPGFETYATGWSCLARHPLR